MFCRVLLIFWLRTADDLIVVSRVLICFDIFSKVFVCFLGDVWSFWALLKHLNFGEYFFLGS